MEKNGFPGRYSRWCCSEYKEIRPDANMIIGIRAEESPKRAKNWSNVKYYKSGYYSVQPIFNWDSQEIWDFIRSEKIKYSSLYDEGFKRIGCVGCPIANRKDRLRDFKRWPVYEKLWKNAFKTLWNIKTGTQTRNGTWFGDKYFRNWQELFAWWLYEKKLPDPNQKDFFKEDIEND